MTRILHLRRFTPVVALLLAGGCADETNEAAQTSDETEARPGQDLVACWAEKDVDSSTKIKCKLGADGAMRVTGASLRAKVGSSSSGTSLDPTRPEATVFASNMVSGARVEVDVTVDASDVVGLGTFHHEETLEIDGATLERPARARAPFDTWRVAITGTDVALHDVHLEPWSLQIGGEAVEIDGALPDVALGEKAVVHLPIQAAGKHTGTARFGESTDASPITIDGPGAYLARADHLEKLWAPNGELPAVLSCWVDATDVLCKAAEPLPLGFLRVTLTHADGPKASKTVVVNHDPRVEMQVIDDRSGDVETFDDVTTTFRVGTVSGASFPLGLDVEASVGGAATSTPLARDGAVLGLGKDDPFMDAPLELHAKLASAAEAPAEAPLVTTLPFAIWTITLVAEAGPRELFRAELDPYVVHFGTPWNGQSAGTAFTVEGALPYVTAGGGSDAVPEQTFHLPIEPGQTAPIAVRMTSGATGDFAFPGPGRYRMGPHGITLAN